MNRLSKYGILTSTLNLRTNSYLSAYKEKEFEKFSLLRQTVEQQRTRDIGKRITSNPYPTIQESTLGAFIEMYEPHLRHLAQLLFDKGYTVDASSGFCGKYDEGQVLICTLSTDHIIINRLAKIGVKVQTGAKMKTLRFWPKTADLDEIIKTYYQVCELLPDSQTPAEPSQTPDAQTFRMKYIPNDMELQRLRLFEILMFTIMQEMSVSIQNRIKRNPYPNDMETVLGSFIEMIEPQVRQTVKDLYDKGYTVDESGFTNTSDKQFLEGDFSLDEHICEQITSSGASVLKNPSGYTRIEFYSQKADLISIRKQWDTIASYFPDTHTQAERSMTKKSRDFRSKYYLEDSNKNVYKQNR